jgi:outer membrane protein TolC
MHKMLALIVVTGLSLLALPSHAAPARSGGPDNVFSLAECLRMALESNLDLVAARKDPAIAAERVDESKAPFDGVVSVGANYNDLETDGDIFDNTPGGGQEPADSGRETLSGDASFGHLLSFGGNYSLTYEHNEVDSLERFVSGQTGFLTAAIGDDTRDTLTLAYEMPLLNGFGKEVTQLNLLLARGDLDISREELRRRAIETVQSVEEAYWNILAAREALRLSKLSLERAEDLLELNRKKVEVGTLAPIEITEAEAGVAAQVEAVILREVDVENAEDLLLQLLAVPEDSPLWGQSLELTDRPSFVPPVVDVEQSIATAIERRPEMEAARKQLRNDELSERVAKRNKRHGLDLTASITPNARGEFDQIVQLPDPFGSDTTTKTDTTNWSVGLRYSYPLRNREAKARYAIARLQSEKSHVNVRNTEQAIRVDVRSAVRELESGIQRIEAAEKNVELQTKKLDAEQKKFDNGMSTSFQVLTFQNDLADAELRQVQARLDYVKALTDFERSQGTLLEARGLSLAD